ncbi:MAG: nucleotidyltransferase domain-containing protein [Bacteroidetes bacterium]|nr:nucleotidyltransferase domain-containing protein [Bacteroidota bacterium]MBU1677771.1 nucleotidyltransferase domain-containing protein [Bacteroidota bacterium]MBU2505512.1 nucleotidyltransferase domain-containing protein [Bacteroidota bacterium]
MRIKKEDIIFIKKITKEYFGNNAKVYLFGSRVDDQKKGGDIDLYIETDMKSDVFKQKLKMLGMLHRVLGEQKIDIVINNFINDKFIYQVAKNEGILL